MCSIATRQLVENSIQGLVGLRKPFTAYDVTKDIRSKGTGASERHDELKKEVHQIFKDGQMSDYGRTLVRIQGAPTPAFLYHPPEVDPNSYLSGTATPQTVVQPASAPQTQVATTVDDSDDDEDEALINRQGNGFIRIPVALVKAIGLNGGDDAAVYHRTSSTFIGNLYTIEIYRPISAPSGSQIQKVDPRGNIRIYNSKLHAAELYGSALKATVDGNHIVISE